MTGTFRSEHDSGQSVIYQIRIKGHLNCAWGDWFGGFAIRLTDHSETVLTGPVADQAALHGLLKKVRDLGLPLLSVNRIEPKPANGLDIKP